MARDPIEKINGQETIEIFNPATGASLGKVPVFSAEEVAAAVERSRRAQADWAKTTFAERRKVIEKLCDVITSDLENIAELISIETGKPVGEAIAMEIAPVLDLMRYFARNTAGFLRPRKIWLGLYSVVGRRSKIIYKPWGVVGIIPAWNYPFSIPLGEAAMALMAGNSVVIKPAESTSLTGLKIGELFRKACDRDGLLQIVTGAGETGAALVDARPDKIMFTGSVATGKKIAKAAADSLISTVLELGGKDPMIVFADADLDIAAKAAVWGAFCNAGQSCSSVERLYVESSAAEQLTRLIVAETLALKQGMGSDESVSIGAMSSERQMNVVEDHVENFRRSGAKIETGGKRRAIATHQPTSEGLFYEPTVISGATNEMRGMREETFGPTLPIATFETEAEAIELANDSEFGLTASVWSGDKKKARRVARAIDAGTVTINEVLYTHGIGQTPWGGFKNSGRGRTHGVEGLLELVQAQHIHEDLFPIVPSPWWMPYSPLASKTFRGFATKFAGGSIWKVLGLLPDLVKRIRELRKKK